VRRRRSRSPRASTPARSHSANACAAFARAERAPAAHPRRLAGSARS
jgi:hypothetical protein